MRKGLEQVFSLIKTYRKQIVIIGLSFIFGIVIFFSVFFYIDYHELYYIIRQFSLLKFLALLGVYLLPFLITTWRWSLILQSEGIKIKFSRLLQYRIAGFGFSYLTPVAELGGAPFRAYLLEKHDNIPFKQGFLGVIVDNFVEVFVQAFVVTSGILTFILCFNLPKKKEWTIGIIASLFILLIILLFRRLINGLLVLSPLLKRFGFKKSYEKIRQWEFHFIHFFKFHKKTFFQCISLSLLSFVISLIEVMLLLYFMGIATNLLQAFFTRVIFNIATLFPVPAGLGVSEWAQAGFFSTTVAGKSAGFIFSILFKALNLFYAFAGIGLFFYWWHKKIRWDKRIVNFIRQKVYDKFSSKTWA